jgi:uncharacterized protein (DUF433 family)
METATIAQAPLLDRISIDPDICFGKPCIRGTRIWVSLILDFLAAGESEAEIIENYPQLTPEDIRAAIAYAADIARERIVPIPVTATETRSSNSTKISAPSAKIFWKPRGST